MSRTPKRKAGGSNPPGNGIAGSLKGFRFFYAPESIQQSGLEGCDPEDFSVLTHFVNDPVV